MKGGVSGQDKSHWDAPDAHLAEMFLRSVGCPAGRNGFTESKAVPAHTGLYLPCS